MLSWVVGIPVAGTRALRPNSAIDNVLVLQHLVPGDPGCSWFGMLIVLASLFWFGYKSPMAGVSLFALSVGQFQIIIGIRRSCLGLGQAAYISPNGPVLPARGHS